MSRKPDWVQVLPLEVLFILFAQTPLKDAQDPGAGVGVGIGVGVEVGVGVDEPEQLFAAKQYAYAPVQSGVGPLSRKPDLAQVFPSAVLSRPFTQTPLKEAQEPGAGVGDEVPEQLFAAKQ